MAILGFASEHDSFRDELASVTRDGRRRWVYARQPSGRFYRARTLVSVLLLAFLFGAPFVHLGGQPLMLLNVLERRFVLLTVPFRPQDFHVVVLVGLTVLLTILLSTVVVGRVWCGWLCPQTVFMEMVFRRLEYLLAGSAEQQLRRDRGGWTAERAARVLARHAVFFALSFLIANVFLAWIIGAGALRVIVTDPPREHLAGLFTILVFSFVFYMVFSRFREQACVLACPYGRLLSALTDSRTITVTYDWRRGEPRGRLPGGTRLPSTSQCDCVDCHRCVTVCPTGIDIRNGLQLECVNCTACMDACDDVMQRVGRPRGLIRLASEEAVRTGCRAGVTPRALAYFAVWLVLVSTTVTLFARLPDVDVLILRQPGTLYATLPNGDLGNFYVVQAFNRTGKAVHFTIEVASPATAEATPLGELGRIDAYGAAQGRLLVRMKPMAAAGGSTPVRLRVRLDTGVVLPVDSAFVGPPGRRN
jgi:cytochrome c oxidase accessory protein FixG